MYSQFGMAQKELITFIKKAEEKVWSGDEWRVMREGQWVKKGGAAECDRPVLQVFQRYLIR